MFQRNNTPTTEINTTIGENSFFRGAFELNGALRVDGCYEGETLVVDNLFVGATGKIKSNIKTSSAVVEGVIIGNIDATSRVMLMPTSRVLGQIKTPELIIQNGVMLEGQCIVTPKTEADPKSAILALYANDPNTKYNIPSQQSSGTNAGSSNASSSGANNSQNSNDKTQSDKN